MNDLASTSLIERAASLLKAARFAVALTGAGISTPSGIPDFRSQKTGLWTQLDPMKVASLTAFRKTPDVFFNWLQPLVKAMFHAEPNPAHTALAQLEKAGILKAVITQNIDCLHQKAGSSNVIEVHGDATHFDCTSCKISYPYMEYINWIETGSPLPVCKKCHRLLKPAITLYEESLPPSAWQKAYSVSEKADVFLVIGSSLEVYPVNQLPFLSVDKGGKLIINSFSTTPLDEYAELLLPYDNAVILPQISQQLL